MQIQLRNVVYSNSIEIANVPVYSCRKCHRSEVLSEVKRDLSNLIKNMDNQTSKQCLQFEETNELAYLLFQASEQELLDLPVSDLVGDRINQLLDLLLLAKSMKDEDWCNDLQCRLEQITKLSVISYPLQ